jgi:hypothetical protein
MMEHNRYATKPVSSRLDSLPNSPVTSPYKPKRKILWRYPVKQILFVLTLIASLYVSAEPAAVDAATGKTVSVDLTINSSGASGAQFVLKGLQTPTAPTYSCSKTSAAAGDGTSVHFAVVDLNGVNRVKVTVKGTLIGSLAVTDATYVNQSGKAISGKIGIRQY